MNLARPKSQIQEVLYELIQHNMFGASRRELMINCGVLKAPDVVKRLRKKGVEITTEEIKTKNKHGNEVTYGNYKIVDVIKATRIYNQLINK